MYQKIKKIEQDNISLKDSIKNNNETINSMIIILEDDIETNNSLINKNKDYIKNIAKKINFTGEQWQQDLFNEDYEDFSTSGLYDELKKNISNKNKYILKCEKLQQEILDEKLKQELHNERTIYEVRSNEPNL